MEMDKRLDLYLEKVEKYLKPLVISERVDIVQEIKSEMCELSANGFSAEQILERLGEPKALAKSYLGDVITRDSSFGWSRMLALFAYYSLAGLSGMVIIPCLGIMAPSFMACGIVCPIVGVVKMIDFLLGLHLPFLQYVGIFPESGVELNPLLEFVGCILIGVALCLAGWLCWKLLLRYIKTVSQTGRRLSL